MSSIDAPGRPPAIAAIVAGSVPDSENPVRPGYDESDGANDLESVLNGREPAVKAHARPDREPAEAPTAYAGR